MKLTKKHARKVLKLVDAGLTSGLGRPEPGQMCIMAAINYAMGLPHGDNPETCVGSAVRAFDIIINDSQWSSNDARAKGMRREAIAKLGSNTLDQVEFSKKLTQDFTPGGALFQQVSKTMGDRAMAAFTWSGGDTHAARVSAARALANFVRHYKFAPGEQLNIVAHSHGGNVAIAAINMGLGHRVDNLVTLGTPSVPSYQMNGTAGFKNWVNLYSPNDKIQSHGGGDDESPLQSGAAARTQPLALNIEWDIDLGDFATHEALRSPAAWGRAISHLDLAPTGDQPMTLWVHE